jgi:hypothetical protein
MGFIGLFVDYRSVIFGFVVVVLLNIYPTSVVSFGDGATLQHHEYEYGINENGAFH